MILVFDEDLATGSRAEQGPRERRRRPDRGMYQAGCTLELGQRERPREQIAFAWHSARAQMVTGFLTGGERRGLTGDDTFEPRRGETQLIQARRGIRYFVITQDQAVV